MKKNLLVLVAIIAAGCESDSGPTTPTGKTTSFFVTSATSVTGNLGGLAGADLTCQRLAIAAGHGGSNWRAYLSVERDPANGNQPTHARDRIGTGPWYNANGLLIANNVAELHARTGDAALFVNEHGAPDQRSVDGLSHAERARHPHRVDSRWKGRTRPDLRGLDIGLCERDRPGWPFRRNGPESEHDAPVVVVELGAHEPELLEHRASRRRGSYLLFRALVRACQLRAQGFSIDLLAPRYTLEMRRVLRMSSSGFASSTMKLASLPAAIVPIFSR